MTPEFQGAAQTFVMLILRVAKRLLLKVGSGQQSLENYSHTLRQVKLRYPPPSFTPP